MRSPLYRHADFRRLWGAQTVSQLGTQVSQLALPLVAVIGLRAPAFQISVLGAVEMLPFLLFALPAGAWVDRIARRPVLVAADLGRAFALGSVPLVAAVSHVTIWQLYAVGFATGTLTVFFDVAYQSYLPSLVARNLLVDANSKLEISRSGAQIAGPGLGGVLVQWLTAPFAVAVDAVSFVWSALLVARIRLHEGVPQHEGERSLRREILEGLRYLLGDARWRAMTTFIFVFNLGTGITGPLILVYVVRRLGLTPSELGLAFALGNVGWLAGALVAGRLTTALGLGRTLFLGALLGGAPFFLVPVATSHAAGLGLLTATQLLVALGLVLFNVPGISLYQTLVPPHLLGRMNASRRWIVWGVIPLGNLIGGGLAALIGVRTTLFAGAAISTVAAGFLLMRPVRTLSSFGGDAAEVAPADA